MFSGLPRQNRLGSPVDVPQTALYAILAGLPNFTLAIHRHAVVLSEDFTVDAFVSLTILGCAGYIQFLVVAKKLTIFE